MQLVRFFVCAIVSLLASVTISHASTLKIRFLNGIQNDPLETVQHLNSLREQYESQRSVSMPPAASIDWDTYYNQEDSIVVDTIETAVQSQLRNLAVNYANLEVQYRRLRTLAVDGISLSPSAITAMTNASTDRWFESFVNFHLHLPRAIPSTRVASVNTELLARLRADLNGDSRVILVAHSQGTLFAEEIWSQLSIDERLRVRVVGAGNAASTSPHDRYVTLADDLVIKAYGLLTDLLLGPLNAAHPLPANVSGYYAGPEGLESFWSAIANPLCLVRTIQCKEYKGHGFSTIYTNPLVLISSTDLTPVSRQIVKFIGLSITELIGFTPPSRYTITPLGNIIPTAINDHGEIVGQCDQVACVRRANEQNWRLLGALGGTYSIAFDINQFGQIVGEATTPTGQGRAFLYSGVLGSPLVDLMPSNLKSSSAYSISDTGDIVGYGYTEAQPQPQAFLLQNGQPQYLGTLPGCSRSIASKVNSSGMVVGYSQDGCPLTAFIKFPNAANMTQIQPLSSVRSIATDVNDSGTVVGDFFPDAVSLRHIGFMYDTKTGVLTEIQNGQYFVDAVAINDRGEVVGTTFGGAFVSAFVYRNATLRDLNQLIPQGTGWHLDQGVAINNLGLIIGRGSLNGESQAFLLTPVQ